MYFKSYDQIFALIEKKLQSKMSFTFKKETPQKYIDEIQNLKKHLPFKQVNNIVVGHNSSFESQQKTYLKLYPYIQEWQLDTFYWKFDLKQIQSADLSEQDRNSKQGILKFIENIRFVNLKCLYIAHSKISSIEPLGWMQMPILSRLSIQHNEIHNFKVIGKCNIPKLEYFHIAKNKFTQAQFAHLSKLKVTSNSRTTLMMLFEKEEMMFSKQSALYQFAPFVKYETKQIKHILWVNQEKVNTKMYQTLHERFPYTALFR